MPSDLLKHHRRCKRKEKKNQQKEKQTKPKALSKKVQEFVKTFISKDPVAAQPQGNGEERK